MLPPPTPPGAPPGALPGAARAPNRNALFSDIQKGKALKKTVTNDRSAPLVASIVSSGPGPSPLGSAPPIPGIPKSPGAMASPPSAPGNRARSNSDQAERPPAAANMGAAPQLGGLFAGVGMPKLRKTGGGVDTGANRDASYLSDPESSSWSATKPLAMSAPRPPVAAAPAIPGRPGPTTSHRSIANLRRTVNVDAARPLSSASLMASLKGPAPPVGKKPPTLPGSRKLSSALGTPPLMPGAPAPPPSLAPLMPPAPPPPPPAAALRHPPTPARHPPQVFASSPPQGPLAAPPPPPSSATAPLPFISHSPSTVSTRSRAPSALRSMLDPSNFTLAHNGVSSKSSSPNPQARSSTGAGEVVSRGERYTVHDPRWKFITEDKFPKPRDFVGGPRRYRAGRGSSVPLDLSLLS